MPIGNDEESTSPEFIHDIDGTTLKNQLATLEGALKKARPESHKAVTRTTIKAADFKASIDVGVAKTLAEYDPIRNAKIKEDTYAVGGQVQYMHIEVGERIEDRLDLNIYHDNNVIILELEHVGETVDPRTHKYRIIAEPIGTLRIHEALGNAISVDGDYHRAHEAYLETAQKIMGHIKTDA